MVQIHRLLLQVTFVSVVALTILNAFSVSHAMASQSASDQTVKVERLKTETIKKMAQVNDQAHHPARITATSTQTELFQKITALETQLAEHKKALAEAQTQTQTKSELKIQNISQEIINLQLKLADVYQSYFQYDIALNYLLEAQKTAQQIDDIGLIIWTSQSLAKAYGLNGDFYLANQTHLRLVKRLEAYKLDSFAAKQKLHWASLALSQQQFARAIELLESTFNYAQKTKNRPLQLQSLILLVRSNINKLPLSNAEYDEYNIEYLNRLMDGLKTIRHLPNALGQKEHERALSRLNILLLNTEFSMLNRTDESQPNYYQLLSDLTQYKKYINIHTSHGQQLIQLLKITYIKLNDWDSLAQLSKQVGYQQSIEKEQFQKKFEEFRNYKLARLAAESERSLADIQSMNENLSTALLALNDKLGNTRWLLLFLVFAVVLLSYQAVLRRQLNVSNRWPHLMLYKAEVQVNKLCSLMRTSANSRSNSNVTSSSNSKSVNQAPFSVVLFDLASIIPLNHKHGVKKMDQAIAMALLKIGRLSKHIQVLPFQGHQYLLIAQTFNQQQCKILISRIEIELRKALASLVIQADLASDGKYANFATYEVLKPTPFNAILSQLESDLAQIKRTEKV